MCIIPSGVAYAIHIENFIIMLLITCHNTWTELQPQFRCEFMEMFENASGNDVCKVVVLYLSIIRLAHTQRMKTGARQALCGSGKRPNSANMPADRAQANQ